MRSDDSRLRVSKMYLTASMVSSSLFTVCHARSRHRIIQDIEQRLQTR